MSLAKPIILNVREEVPAFQAENFYRNLVREEKKTNLARRCFTSSSWSDSFVNKGSLLYDFLIWKKWQKKGSQKVGKSHIPIKKLPVMLVFPYWTEGRFPYSLANGLWPERRHERILERGTNNNDKTTRRRSKSKILPIDGGVRASFIT